MPGSGIPHAIFLPRQKRQASSGFFSGVFLRCRKLRPIDGDGTEFSRNSVVGGVDGQGVMGDATDGLGCDWSVSCGRSRSLQSDD
jgi:hypothetical protein